MELSILQIIAALSAVSVGAFVQTAVGFGIAIIAAPILYLIEPQLVPVPIILASVTQTTLVLIFEGASARLDELKPAVFGHLPGVALGVWILSISTQSQLALGMGAAVLMAVAVSLLSKGIASSKRNFFIAGALSGLMGSTTGIGGPPIALMFQHQSGPQLRANLAAFFTVAGGLSLAGIALSGQVPKGAWSVGALFVPVVCGSFLLAKKLAPPNISWARQAILALSSFAGVVSILKGWA